MPHKCDGFIIACMDWRIQDAVNRLIRELGLYGKVDVVCVRGGAGNKHALYDHLDTSNHLHEPDVFILTAHEDCGAGTTLVDLVRAYRRVLLDLEPGDQVLAFWFYQSGIGLWEWREVRLSFLERLLVSALNLIRRFKPL